MKGIIYARESSKDTNKAPPIEEQIDRGKTWFRENNHDLIEILPDNGFSGGDWNRPAWQKAVKMAKSHKMQFVWVWDQDRLARDTEQFLWFYRELMQVKVKVYTATDGWIDMESAGGRIKHTALAQSAEIFRLITSEKVKNTYKAKKVKAEKQGKKLLWGRKAIKVNLERILKIKKENPKWGYRQIAKANNDLISESELRALKEANPEWSARKIKSEAGFVSYMTVKRVLHNTPPNFEENPS